MKPEELLQGTLSSASVEELDRAWAEHIIEQATRSKLSSVWPRDDADYVIAFICPPSDDKTHAAGRHLSEAAERELRHWCEEAGLLFDGHVLIDHAGRMPEKALAVQAENAVRPFVVVPLGEEALVSIVGPGGSIHQRRGSVYKYWGHSSIVPMLDPRDVIKQSKWRRRCISDMKRVKCLIDGESPLKDAPRQSTLIYQDGPWPSPTSPESQRALRDIRNHGSKPDAPPVVIDIETSPKDERIVCIGIAWSSRSSVVLEWPEDGDVSAEAKAVYGCVRAICESPVEKILHNGLYDLWWLRHYAEIEVNNYKWDTLCMAHAWYPADNLSLDYLTSICPDTWDVPYYKQEGKDIYTKGVPKTHSELEQLMVYCGKDTMCTYSLYEWLRSRLAYTYGNLGFYETHYVPKFRPMLDMMLRGVRIDNAARIQAFRSFMETAEETRDELMLYNNLEPMFKLDTQRDRAVFDALQADDPAKAMVELTQYDPGDLVKSVNTITKKAVSTQKLRTLLYDRMGLPEQYERRADGNLTPTVGNLTLRKLLLQYGQERPEVAAVIKLALQHTRARKLATFAGNSIMDTDGRMRFSLGFTPETGRFSSSRNPAGRGLNSQNIPRDKRLRRMILPEEGHVLLKFDMSQVEARICFMLTRDPELLRYANLRSSEYDQHSENAVLLGLAKDVQSAKGEPRQIAKHAVHGAQRNMQAQTLADTLLKLSDIEQWETLNLPDVQTCERMLAAYHACYPAIREVFFKETETALRRYRYLTNSFGRRWSLEYDDINDEALRRAYSFMLQSEAADLMNCAGFTPLFTRAIGCSGRLMLHEHDELVFSVPPEAAYNLACACRDYVEQPYELAGNEYFVPIEFGLGTSWAYEYEWKELPSEEEMTYYAFALLKQSK